MAHCQRASGSVCILLSLRPCDFRPILSLITWCMFCEREWIYLSANKIALRLGTHFIMEHLKITQLWSTTMKLTSGKRVKISFIHRQHESSHPFSDLVLASTASAPIHIDRPEPVCGKNDHSGGKTCLDLHVHARREGLPVGFIELSRPIISWKFETQQNQFKRMAGCLVVLNGMFSGTL